MLSTEYDLHDAVYQEKIQVRSIDRQTDTQTDRQTDTQTDRQTERQTDTHLVPSLISVLAVAFIN